MERLAKGGVEEDEEEAEGVEGAEGVDDEEEGKGQGEEAMVSSSVFVRY